MSLESRGPDPGAEEWGGESRRCSRFSGFIRSELVWKLGVWLMCLGVRSPSGGEAGRGEGVIHKLRPASRGL